MKTIFKRGILLSAILLSLFITLVVLADPPAPPGGNGGPGSTPVSGGGTPVGAPIDGGLFILLALGAGYGAKKVYNLRKEHLEE
ncbi:MAG TPA: hypothetical protein VF298_06030 [Bacteroidales bacterium]